MRIIRILHLYKVYEFDVGVVGMSAEKPPQNANSRLNTLYLPGSLTFFSSSPYDYFFSSLLILHSSHSDVRSRGLNIHPPGLNVRSQGANIKSTV